jgi:hypothetical protein
MGCKELEITLQDARHLATTLSELIISLNDEDFIHHASEAIYKISGGVSVYHKRASVVKIQFKTSGLSVDNQALISEVTDPELSANSNYLLSAAEKR